MVSGFFGEDFGKFREFFGEDNRGGFAFSVAAASSIAVVSLATTGDPRTKQESPRIIL